MVFLHKSDFYRDKYTGGGLPNCDSFANSLLHLPLYYELSNSEIDYICDTIDAFFR